jgi:hypothetical protein
MNELMQGLGRTDVLTELGAAWQCLLKRRSGRCKAEDGKYKMNRGLLGCP